jgi:SAM-dependent methyltransferase
MEKIVVVAWDHSTFFWTYDGGHRLCMFKLQQLFGDSIPLKYITVDFREDATNIIKNALRNTVQKKKYNGWANTTEFGYHSFNVFNLNIQGQRNPEKRFQKIKQFYDFTGKSVLDLGCNTGGMLFHIPEIKKGVGIDYDEDCISACNTLRDRFNFSCDLEFYQKDLNECNITEFCKSIHYRPDIVFLLSLGSWVKNWSELYTNVFNTCDTILLETNNDSEGAPQLELFRSLNTTITLISDKSDDDCTGNRLRKTYLIKKVN